MPADTNRNEGTAGSEVERHEIQCSGDKKAAAQNVKDVVSALNDQIDQARQLGLQINLTPLSRHSDPDEKVAVEIFEKITL